MTMQNGIEVSDGRLFVGRSGVSAFGADDDRRRRPLRRHDSSRPSPRSRMDARGSIAGVSVAAPYRILFVSRGFFVGHGARQGEPAGGPSVVEG